MLKIFDPKLNWRYGNIPASSRFDDPYYSLEGGLAESQHVFLSGAGLPDNWFGKRRYTIAELGFGTGLNFLITWKAWRDSGQAGHLHFVSIEGYPMDNNALHRAHKAFPEIDHFSQRLRDVMPDRRAGYHLRCFDQGHVSLLLVYGDVAAVLHSMHLKADAWFLDGFAPSKNPEMWTEELLCGVASLAKPGARIATYTAAGSVRRGLESAGFEVIKRPGFGAKRECLSGCLSRLSEGNKNILSAWGPYTQLTSYTGPVAVIGAGIAGMSVARALVDAGVETLIFDRHNGPSAGMSATPSGILQPRPLSDGSPAAEFFAAAFDYAAYSYNSLDNAWLNRGVLVLGRDDADAARYKKLLGAQILDDADCKAVSGIDLKLSGVWFTKGGVLNSTDVCEQLGAGSSTFFGRTIVDFWKEADIWRLSDDQGRSYEATAIVLAGGMETLKLSGFSALGLQANRGQISFLDPSRTSQRLAAAITFGGYLTPPLAGRHVLGATFDREPKWANGDWTEIREESHTRNLKSLMLRVPAIKETLGAASGGWTGLRATTSDRFPVLGPVPETIMFKAALSSLREGQKLEKFHMPIHKIGLYVLSGLGARGFLTAPLAGRVLVSQMFGQPLPVPVQFLAAVNPGRFLMRAMKRERD